MGDDGGGGPVATPDHAGRRRGEGRHGAGGLDQRADGIVEPRLVSEVGVVEVVDRVHECDAGGSEVDRPSPEESRVAALETEVQVDEPDPGGRQPFDIPHVPDVRPAAPRPPSERQRLDERVLRRLVGDDHGPTWPRAWSRFWNHDSYPSVIADAE